VLARAVELARAGDGAVHVLAVGRVHGSAFGMPNPGLLPTRKELEELYDEVDRVVAALEAKGLRADGQVLTTRNGAKRIVREAVARGCEAIVMGADPPRSAVRRNFMWSQEPQRVQRRSQVPVHLIEDP
jgi:nucleotide-binding universal stress UspA family protein